MELIFLQPIFKERIWGGNTLMTEFGYSIPSKHTGECWAISAHKNGETIIKNGAYTGWALSKLWHEHAELFANTELRQFPLLIKILDANSDLSVQVHPNDEYATVMENDLGKAECWYILAAKPDAKIVYGHTANTIEEFKQLALTDKWSSLLNSEPVKAGDFFDLAPGTVHALGGGILVFEVQQSSDSTYRLYDYNRRDDKGNLRELHLEKAFAVINIPHQSKAVNLTIHKLSEAAVLTNLTSNKYFKVNKLDINGTFSYGMCDKYLLISVISGEAVVNGYNVSKGDNFIVPNPVTKLDITGTISLIITSESD